MPASPDSASLSPALAEAVERAVAQMVPSVQCRVRRHASSEDAAAHMGVDLPSDGELCRATDDGVLVCWGGEAGCCWTAEMTRAVPLTASEVELLELLPGAMASTRTVRDGMDGALASGDLLEESLALRLLHGRGGGRIPRRAIATVLGAVRQLSFRRYEGRPATSGVVVVADVAAHRAAMDADPRVAFDAFAGPLRLDRAFFDRPASHRSVDGRNCFYVVGPDLMVHGLVRADDRGDLDQLDVAAGRHVDRVIGSASPARVIDRRRQPLDVRSGCTAALHRRHAYRVPTPGRAWVTLTNPCRDRGADPSSAPHPRRTTRWRGQCRCAELRPGHWRCSRPTPPPRVSTSRCSRRASTRAWPAP